jgi:hypothetical protein
MFIFATGINYNYSNLKTNKSKLNLFDLKTISAVAGEFPKDDGGGGGGSMPCRYMWDRNCNVWYSWGCVSYPHYIWY